MTIRNLERRLDDLESKSTDGERWTLAEILTMSDEEIEEYEELPDGRYQHKDTGVVRPSVDPLLEVLANVD